MENKVGGAFLVKAQPIPDREAGCSIDGYLDGIALAFCKAIPDGMMAVSKGTFTEACIGRGVDSTSGFIHYKLKGGWQLVWSLTITGETVLFGNSADMTELIMRLRR